MQVERESSVVSLKKGRAGLAVAASAQDLGDLSTGESCRRSNTESVFEKPLKESELENLKRDSTFASFTQDECGKAENSSRGRESTTGGSSEDL